MSAAPRPLMSALGQSGRGSGRWKRSKPSMSRMSIATSRCTAWCHSHAPAAPYCKHMNPQTFEVLPALTKAVARLGSAVEAIRQQMPEVQQQSEVANSLHDALRSAKEAIDVLTSIAKENKDFKGGRQAVDRCLRLILNLHGQSRKSRVAERCPDRCFRDPIAARQHHLFGSSDAAASFAATEVSFRPKRM